VEIFGRKNQLVPELRLQSGIPLELLLPERFRFRLQPANCEISAVLLIVIARLLANSPGR
jgi:hypothetical protein